MTQNPMDMFNPLRWWSFYLAFTEVALAGFGSAMRKYLKD
jgi:hypothetical protein